MLRYIFSEHFVLVASEARKMYLKLCLRYMYLYMKMQAFLYYRRAYETNKKVTMNSPNKSEKENYLKETELSLKKFRSQITILEKWIAEAEADIKARNEQKMDQILGQ